MRYLFLFFNAILLSLLSVANNPNHPSADKVSVTGKVKSGNEQIPFATVVIKGTTIGTAADATGNFKLDGLPSGQHTVVISAIGYKPYSTEIDLNRNHAASIIAELLPDNIGIEQVVVSADRNARNRQQTPTLVSSIGPNLFSRASTCSKK